MSKQAAIAQTRSRTLPPCRIISIDEIGFSTPLSANPHIKEVLRLNFGDWEDNAPGSMTFNQAKEILDFAKKIEPQETLIIHCVGGVSRSAGVAAGLAHIFNGEEAARPYFISGKYSPNMRCYALLLIAAGIIINQGTLHYLRKINMQALVKAYDSHERTGHR